MRLVRGLTIHSRAVWIDAMSEPKRWSCVGVAPTTRATSKSSDEQRGMQFSITPKSGCNRSCIGTPVISVTFQSSAAPKSGCNGNCAARPTAPLSFNPQPLRRVAVTEFGWNLALRHRVSILKPLRRVAVTVAIINYACNGFHIGVCAKLNLGCPSRPYRQAAPCHGTRRSREKRLARTPRGFSRH